MTNTTAVLLCTERPMPGAVPLLFNPDKVTMTREIGYRAHGSSSQGGGKAGESGTNFRKAEALKINLNDVVFSGMETKPLCDQLFNWMSPGSGDLGQQLGAVMTARLGANKELCNKLPELQFIYGPPEMGFCYTVVLISATANYTRFTSAGVPVRARVTINMKEVPSLLGTLPTNPTSGGLPGRRSYTVTEGEDLVNLARTHYGSTSHWRRVADANGIDDPLRMRPGTTVYLPSPQELH